MIEIFFQANDIRSTRMIVKRAARTAIVLESSREVVRLVQRIVSIKQTTNAMRCPTSTRDDKRSHGVISGFRVTPS